LLRAFERLARITLSHNNRREPFLDAEISTFHFRPVQRCAFYNARIDTNGFWKPDRYPEVNWNKIRLNISYHPTQVSLDQFEKSVKEKIGAGIKIGMINFVFAPSQMRSFEEISARMEPLGLLVNANVFVETSERQTAEGLKAYEKYIPKLDIDIKTGRMTTRGGCARFRV
jgi:hypothetical protein